MMVGKILASIAKRRKESDEVKYVRLIVIMAIVIVLLLSQAANAATYTDKDVNTLARLVWLEARGESDQGQRAVVEVVLNRVEHEKFPSTVQEVVYANNGKGRWQFSPAKKIPKTLATSKEYRNVYHVLYGGERILPVDVVYFSTTAANSRVYCKIGCHIFCKI